MAWLEICRVRLVSDPDRIVLRSHGALLFMACSGKVRQGMRGNGNMCTSVFYALDLYSALLLFTLLEWGNIGGIAR